MLRASASSKRNLKADPNASQTRWKRMMDYLGLQYSSEWLEEVLRDEVILDLTQYIHKERCIGSGSYGEVYKASLINIPPRLAKKDVTVPTLAIKIIRVGAAKDERSRNRRLRVSVQPHVVNRNTAHAYHDTRW